MDTSSFEKGDRAVEEASQWRCTVRCLFEIPPQGRVLDWGEMPSSKWEMCPKEIRVLNKYSFFFNFIFKKGRSHGLKRSQKVPFVWTDSVWSSQGCVWRSTSLTTTREQPTGTRTDPRTTASSRSTADTGAETEEWTRLTAAASAAQVSILLLLKLLLLLLLQSRYF